MTAASRRKGLLGEREAADLFVGAGWTVRGLEGSGDMLAYKVVQPRPYYSWNLHLEVKRAERLRLPEWTAQARNEAPPGVPWVLAHRQSRMPWLATLELASLLEMIG